MIALNSSLFIFLFNQTKKKKKTLALKASPPPSSLVVGRCFVRPSLPSGLRRISTRTDQLGSIDTHPSHHSSHLQAVGPTPAAAQIRKPMRHASFMRKTRPVRVSVPFPNETPVGLRLLRLQAVAERRVSSPLSLKPETRPACPAPRELDRPASPFTTRVALHLSAP